MAEATIFALATAPGRAAVAIVRLSGPRTREALLALTPTLPAPREAALRKLRAPDSGDLLDRALVLWFPAPASYTGEDQAELHLHGGPAVIAAVFSSLTRLGLTMAAPGQFTRRAFQNGKLDLSEAEAVADLVDAETDSQRRQALDQLGGELRRRHESWRSSLLEAAAHVEAAIDFPDEDVPGGLIDTARQTLRVLASELSTAVQDQRGERIRDGFRIAIVGPPNAGKSSLLNALAERDVAIVTELEGTTRDVIEVRLNLDGYDVVLADTAGLRRSEDRIEIEGMRRARDWAGAADLRVLVLDQADPSADWCATAWLLLPGDLMVLNKADLPRSACAAMAAEWGETAGLATLAACADTGDVGALQDELTLRVTKALAGGDMPAVTRARHRNLLIEASQHLEAAQSAFEPELIAEHLRASGNALARVTGRIGTEDILGEVFARFCIGK